MKIITACVYPPIPIRRYDWNAVREGYDEGDPVGWGATEQDRKSTRLNSSHVSESRMPSSA